MFIFTLTATLIKAQKRGKKYVLKATQSLQSNIVFLMAEYPLVSCYKREGKKCFPQNGLTFLFLKCQVLNSCSIESSDNLLTAGALPARL